MVKVSAVYESFSGKGKGWLISLFHELFILFYISGLFLVPIYCKGRANVLHVSRNSEWTLMLWTLHTLYIRRGAPVHCLNTTNRVERE